MNILVISSEDVQEEFDAKFGGDHNYTFIPAQSMAEHFVDENDIIIDFSIEVTPENINMYIDKPEKLVFVNSVKTSLAELQYHFGAIQCKIFGFNGLPTFLGRDIFEVTLLNEDDKSALDYSCKELDTEYLLVADRAGMVTPRIICMIINEACYTLQEGTASIADIDLGMKLGTNYPLGPFEWANKMGVDHAYEILEAMYLDTSDERYKICPLLKTKYLKVEEFELN